MKIEINHPGNISLPPPPKFSNPLHKLNTTEIIPIPPEKIANTSESISMQPSKKFKPLPKNSITITEIISNTRTKSQPLPKKSQPLVNNSQSLLKKSQPPKKIFNPL